MSKEIEVRWDRLRAPELRDAVKDNTVVIIPLGATEQHGPHLPTQVAIALTAFARSDDRTRALRAAFLVHVSKPVEPSEPVATVATVASRTGDPTTA